MWTDLQDRPYTVADVSTPAVVETLETYQDAISRFEDKQWTYMPLPGEGKYYNIRTDELREIDAAQRVSSDLHLLDIMERLIDQPFLLVEEDDSYEIANLSDLNHRTIKEFIYPVLSELENQLSKRIADEFESSEKLIGNVGEFTVGNWYLARREDVELHIAEFLTLGQMIGIIKGHDGLIDRCGFEGPGDVDQLGGIETLRNRVMHGNRAFVHDREMLASHLNRIERAQRIVRRLA